MCGFRDDDGHVIKVEQLKTLEIPRQVRHKRNTWVKKKKKIELVRPINTLFRIRLFV
jgi:hypothetical protein